LTKKLRIGVVFGGRSAEHEVSLVSGSSIMTGLDKDKYEIIPIGISKSGKWLAGPEALALLTSGNTEQAQRVFLPADPNCKALENLTNSHPQKTGGAWQQLDVLFPVLHGTYGEDGTIQGLFELTDIPYVGAGVLGSSLSMDKILQKQICVFNNLPVVDYLWFKECDWTNKAQVPAQTALCQQLTGMSKKEIINNIIIRLGLPVFVKPPNLGSSVGISKAHDEAELENAIEQALGYDQKVLVEKAVNNAREIEVSVLGNEHPKASVAGEVRPSNEFYDYDAKYIDGKSELIIPANLADELHLAICNTAVQSFMAVAAEGFARVDFLLDNKTKNFYLNELNTIPGFTKISMYPKLWQASGLGYSELLDELIRLAIERHARRSSKKTTFTPKNDWYK
jgi:D-alanine-D-alanine ligase